MSVSLGVVFIACGTPLTYSFAQSFPFQEKAMCHQSPRIQVFRQCHASDAFGFPGVSNRSQRSQFHTKSEMRSHPLPGGTSREMKSGTSRPPMAEKRKCQSNFWGSVK